MDTHEREATIKANHTCACEQCDPSLTVFTQRQGPHHVGVRFWSDEEEVLDRQLKASILLDGVKVERAFEAILGDDGMVWAYRSEPAGVHMCVTCLERLRAKGLVASDSTWVIGGFTFTPEHIVGVCTVKQAGKVELRVPAKAH
jgi:hypothetical protein